MTDLRLSVGESYRNTPPRVGLTPTPLVRRLGLSLPIVQAPMAGGWTTPELPVIAAGGIMDGRGVIAALAPGAEGAQLAPGFCWPGRSGATAREVARAVASVVTGKEREWRTMRWRPI